MTHTLGQGVLSSQQKLPAFENVQTRAEEFCEKHDVYIRYLEQVGSVNYRLIEVCRFGQRLIEYRLEPGEEMGHALHVIMDEPNKYVLPVGCGGLWHYEAHGCHSSCPSCGGNSMRSRRPFDE